MNAKLYWFHKVHLYVTIGKQPDGNPPGMVHYNNPVVVELAKHAQPWNKWVCYAKGGEEPTLVPPEPKIMCKNHGTGMTWEEFKQEAAAMGGVLPDTH